MSNQPRTCQYCYREVKPPYNYHEKGDCEEAYRLLLNELKWKKYPISTDGFVTLVDVMGDDLRIAESARNSYGAGTKRVSDDRTLIRYLKRHSHTTPLESVVFQFFLRLDMATMRQLIRHRMSTTNEYSTRYSIAIDSTEITPPGEWRLQSATNKQGSSGEFVAEWPDDFTVPLDISDAEGNQLPTTPGNYLSYRERQTQEFAREVYEERLQFGVAREQARKDLPLATYTQAYWKIDLHNLMHFLSLRMDSHAQLEIRRYAAALYDIARQICPIAMEAFDDYDFRRGAMLLTALDRKVMKGMLDRHDLTPTGFVASCSLAGWPPPPTRCRERDEAQEKLLALGFLTTGDPLPCLIPPPVLISQPTNSA